MLVFGRSPNLILGAATAIFNVFVAFHILGFAPDASQQAVVNLALGAIIAVVANDSVTQIKGGLAAQARHDNAVSNGNGNGHG